MSHWTFIVAAYALTGIGTVALTWWSYAAMRRAEVEAAALRDDR